MEEVISAAVNYIYTSKKYIFISVDKARIQLCCEKIKYFEGDRSFLYNSNIRNSKKGG